jgi:hypothetical protein
MNVGVGHCGRDTFGIGKLFTYVCPLSATKELAQFVGPFITKKTRYKPNKPFGVLDYHAANNTLSPGKDHLKKICFDSGCLVTLALDRDRKCHHAVTQWRQSLHLPAPGC